MGGYFVGAAAGKSLSGLYLKTLRCRKLKPGRDISWGYRFVLSWCDFTFTFDLAVVTLIFKILSRLHLRNHKV